MVLNILVIDDNQLYIDGLTYVLNKLAAQVIITATIHTTDVVTILDQGTEFDLILIDINMPPINGLELLQQFSADTLCIPIVILSSEYNISLLQQALNWGVMGFIPKSYTAQQMIAALQDVLAGSMYLPIEVQQQISNRASVRTH